MLPTQQFDGIPPANPLPPWTPPVWKSGPDVLRMQAQQQLFQIDGELQHTLGAGQGSVAMSGPAAQPENESDMLIDGSTPGDSPSHGEGGTTRVGIWHNALTDMRRDEPLASWASGQKDGKANPPA